MVAQLVKKSPIYEAFRQNEGLFLEVIQDAAFESARRMGEKASEIYSIKNRSLWSFGKSSEGQTQRGARR